MTKDERDNLLARLESNYGDESANQAEAADVIRELLAECERLRNKCAALTLVAYGTPENPKDPLRADEPTAPICDHDIYTYAAMGYGVAECTKCGKSWDEKR